MGQCGRTEFDQELAPLTFHRRAARSDKGKDQPEDLTQISGILHGEVGETLHREGLDDSACIKRFSRLNRRACRAFP